MNRQRASELFHLMLTSREIDEREQLLVSQNLALRHEARERRIISQCETFR